MKAVAAIFGFIVGIIVLAVVLTPLCVFFGWITGHIINFFCGDFVASGLNTLFGTTRFAGDQLPVIGGALGFVGSFFKASNTNKSND